MKAGWKIAKLGDVCHVYQPETLSQKQLKDGPYPVYGANGQIGFHNEFNHAEPQLTLGCRGTCGVVNWTTENAWINGNAMVVKAVEELVTPQFLSYALKGGINIGDSISGTAQPQITRKSLTPIEIPLPPLAEQKRIVALLDEAFAGIDEAKAKAEQSIKRNTDLYKSLLQSSFANQAPEWVEMTLENCCEQIFAGGDVPKGRLSDQQTKEFNVPIYANGEKDAGLYGFTDIARVTKPSITVSARGTLGFTAIRTEPFFPIVRLIVLVPDEKKVSLPFLYHVVTGMDFGNTGTSIPQLTVPNFKESRLRVPGLKTQNAVTGKIDTIRENGQSLRRLHEQKLSMLKELKNSLLAQAFAGELTA
jgi:type I restriction enzyme S subunit